MSLQDILIRPRSSLAGFRFDGILREEHTNTVEVTNERLENGAVVSDNAVVQPVELSITVITTNTPVTFQPALGQIVDVVTGLFGSSKDTKLTRTQSAYEFLINLMEARTPITVSTQLMTYTNMLLTSIPVSQDADTSGVLQSTLRLKQISIVDSRSTLASNNTTGNVATALSETTRGRVATEPPSEDENKSVLKKLADWAL